MRKFRLPTESQFAELRPQITDIGNRYAALARRTDRCDRAAAESAIADLYRALEMPTPTMVWFESPLSACAASISWNLAQVVGGDAEFDSPVMWYRLRTLMCLDVHRRIAFPELLYPVEWEAPWFEFDDLIWASPDVPAGIRSAGHTSVAVGNELISRIGDREWWQSVVGTLAAQLDESIGRALERFTATFNSLSDQSRTVTLHETVMSEFELRRRSRFNEAEYGSAFLAEVMPLLSYECKIPASKLSAVAEHCWWWRAEPTVCFLVDRPTETFFDARGRAHRENGYAISYGDELCVYCIGDVTVPKRVAFRQFDAADIDAEQNVEVRRVMIELFGIESYLRESGAELVQRDVFGELYRKFQPDDEPIVMVKVVNSTLEPDGTRKEYFLRVPPNILTARQAIAWTFGMEQLEYYPDRET